MPTLWISVAPQLIITALCSILSKAVNVASFSFNGIVTDNTLPESRWDTSLARIPLTVIAAVTGSAAAASHLPDFDCPDTLSANGIKNRKQ
jgi:hypothetical protein